MRILVFQSWKHCEKTSFIIFKNLSIQQLNPRSLCQKGATLAILPGKRENICFSCYFVEFYILFIHIQVNKNKENAKHLLCRWFLNVYFCCLSSCQLCLCIWFSKSLLWHTFRAVSCVHTYISLSLNFMEKQNFFFFLSFILLCPRLGKFEA